MYFFPNFLNLRITILDDECTFLSRWLILCDISIIFVLFSKITHFIMKFKSTTFKTKLKVLKFMRSLLGQFNMSNLRALS